jgi:putative transposase
VREEHLVTSASPAYRGYRYPADVIAQAVRLYFRFPLSYRGIEELLFERGVVVSYETCAVRIPGSRSI